MVSPTLRRTVGVVDVPVALFSPRRVFAKVEDVPAYGMALFVLLTLSFSIGFAVVQTGLIEREVGLEVQTRIAEIEKVQFDIVERSTLSQLIEAEQKRGRWDVMRNNLLTVVVAPLLLLATILMIPALLYGLVAMTGRKPEWHTLVTLSVFAGYTTLLRALASLLLMLRFHSMDVDTSPAILAKWMNSGADSAGASLAGFQVLSGFDPFRIWFWIMIAIGLSTTSQLRGWRAWLSCGLFWLTATCVRTGLAFAVA